MVEAMITLLESEKKCGHKEYVLGSAGGHLGKELDCYLCLQNAH